jgi:hypothetical protein
MNGDVADGVDARGSCERRDESYLYDRGWGAGRGGDAMNRVSTTIGGGSWVVWETR